MDIEFARSDGTDLPALKIIVVQVEISIPFAVQNKAFAIRQVCNRIVGGFGDVLFICFLIDHL